MLGKLETHFGDTELGYQQTSSHEKTVISTSQNQFRIKKVKTI